ncbi:MAG: bifunctional folylpolyglutamate synthase/dihydrofolate synthase, partial [Stellaceae bacterium]
MSASSDCVLERLQKLHPRLIDLSLDRVLRLLETLGRPQDHLPPVIHVAGTNGKGSTVAFLRAFLEAAGRRVHVYT